MKAFLNVFLSTLLVVILSGCASLNNNFNEAGSYYWNGVVEIRDSQQYVEVRTEDLSQPVLLFLHGGPGGSTLPWSKEFFFDLESDFVVVHWDQRGAGKSYSGEIPHEYQTIDSFVEDTHYLTSYLKRKLGKEKIFLFGNSWGSVLGMHAVSRYPDDYHAIAIDGVAADTRNNWMHSYDLMLEKAKDNGNWLSVWRLENIGRPGEGFSLDPNSTHRKYFDFLISTKNSNRNIPILSSLSSLKLLLTASYNPISMLRRMENSSSILMSEVYQRSLVEDVQSVDVPVYFFIGRHDFHTPYTLAEEYFNLLDADEKYLFWFDESAHAPHVSENGKFTRLVRGMKNDQLFQP